MTFCGTKNLWCWNPSKYVPNNLLRVYCTFVGNIRVFCRIRPIFNSTSRSSIEYIGEDGSVMVFDPLKPQLTRKVFHFNKVFGPRATQGKLSISFVSAFPWWELGFTRFFTYQFTSQFPFVNHIHISPGKWDRYHISCKIWQCDDTSFPSIFNKPKIVPFSLIDLVLTRKAVTICFLLNLGSNSHGWYFQFIWIYKWLLLVWGFAIRMNFVFFLSLCEFNPASCFVSSQGQPVYASHLTPTEELKTASQF